MRTAALFLGITFLTFLSWTNGAVEVEWACRDRHLWLHVLSKQPVQFEALDPNGVHPINTALASRCGYTISTFKAGDYTTFRASYYSCFTLSQDDQVFTFQLNVIVSDGASEWVSQPLSAVCSGLSWIQREMVCEEDYMEVNVRREASCAAQPGPAGQAGQAALSQAVKTASWASQLMFPQADGHPSLLTIAEAESLGYALTLTAERAVLRASYQAAEAQLIQVDGVPVVVLSVFVFYKRQLMVVMMDMSMACPVNSVSYDGARLVWDVPGVLRPLLQEGAAFKSLKRSLEVDGVMLDEPSAAAKGLALIQQEELVQILVPFGAEGGYRRSLVVNNMYKETFVMSLLYEHRFSETVQDGSSIETKVGIARVLQTPLLCRPPFSLDQTDSGKGVFAIYLGNIPSDVILDEVQVNKEQLLMEPTEGGLIVTPVEHLNGSRAYELLLPFSNAAVRRTYMGEGVVQYAIDVNFTLSHMPQKDSYYHHTFISAQVFSAFPPKITAQCLDRGIVFSVAMPPGAESLWEVGVDHHPLTPQLAAQRGYKLLNDTHKIILEVPVFSIGYTYEDINLSNFYGTFKLQLRDTRTLEIQTSTSKHCLFKTEDMIVCSADGIITVVTRPTSTWPTVQPERTSLLDPTCRPKETDASRVLFQFKLDSCGTRATVGDYMVYENEILHDRQLIADGPNVISRDSQFKLTVRCFYPLSGINRLTADRVARSDTPGFGSIDVFGSLTDPENLPPDCLQHLSTNEIMSLSETEHTRAKGKVESAPLAEPGQSHSISMPVPPNKMQLNSPNQQSVPKLNEYIPTPPRPATAPTQGQLEDAFPLKYDWTYGRFQPSRQKYGDVVASWDAKRVEDSGPIRNWSPVSQMELYTPKEPQWTLKKEAHQHFGPFHTETNQRQRPGKTPPIYPSKRIPVPQMPNKLVVQNQSVNHVQNIRVKPQRRLTFKNPSHRRIHSASSSLPVVSNAELQMPQRPAGTKPGNWQHLAETRNAPGRMSSAIQIAGPSQIMTGPALGGFLAPAPRWSSDGVSSLSVPVKTAPHFSNHQEFATRYMDGEEARQGNMESTASQMGSGGKGVDSRTSDQSDCHGPSAAYGASIHRGIIRATESKRPSSGGLRTRN